MFQEPRKTASKACNRDKDRATKETPVAVACAGIVSTQSTTTTCPSLRIGDRQICNKLVSPEDVEGGAIGVC
jgi:hypothetical protein